MVKTPGFHCKERVFNPWLGNLIRPNMLYGQKKVK